MDKTAKVVRYRFSSSNIKETDMEKQEVMDKLEEIRDLVDTDFLNRHTIEGVIDDINNLIFHLNTNTKEF